MCGIAGFTHGARGLDEAVIRRVTASLTQQPSGFELLVDHHVIACNGNIYNNLELRTELETRGHRFVSSSDEEVVLRAFIEWDTACFRRFRGSFALAIWNIRRKRLVLARDRVGIKPLYIAAVGRHLVFGSELKAIFDHPRISRTLDLNALQDYLSLGYTPGARTLVEGIEKLPPGHFLEWRDGTRSQTRWWNPCLTPDITMDEREAESELDRLLCESVREHLPGSESAGIWGSALRPYAPELKTFSFEPEPEDDLVSALEDMADYADEPTSALPAWFLARRTSQQVSTVLSAAGREELFGGYFTWRAARVATPLRWLSPGLRHGMLRASRRLLPVSSMWKRWLAGSLLHPDEAHLSWNGSFSMEQKQRLLPNIGPQRLFHLYAGLPDAETAGTLNRYMLVDQQNYLPDNLLCSIDRMSTAHSLEVHLPFLDHRIVELARTMPKRIKKRVKPDDSPEQTAAHQWLRGPLLPFLNDTLQPGVVRRTGLFDASFVSKVIRDHRDRRANAGNQLWTLMTLFLWVKRWDIAIPDIESEFLETGRLAAAS